MDGSFVEGTSDASPGVLCHVLAKKYIIHNNMNIDWTHFTNDSICEDMQKGDNKFLI